MAVNKCTGGAFVGVDKMLANEKKTTNESQ